MLQADDTGIRVLARDDEKGTLRGDMWAFVGDGRHVAFAYAPDWRAEHPSKHIGDRRGYLQVDGYKSYDKILKDVPDAIRVGMLHARTSVSAQRERDR